MSSGNHLEMARLLEYWLGELDAEAESLAEDHLFACDDCGARLDEVIALASGIRAQFESGNVHAFVSEEFIQRLIGQGLRVREYRIPVNGSVNCCVFPDDQMVFARLEAPLHGVSRLDAVEEGSGEKARVFEDIPFDAKRGAAFLVPKTAALRKMPAHRACVRLIAVRDGARDVIGDYTFLHSPPTSPASS
jgi:hypothetical protein